MQEIAAALAVAAAVAWLAVRWWKRRASANCCGEAECPAAKQTVRRLERARR